jgi:Xaa-Pro aminopeptidase
MSSAETYVPPRFDPVGLDVARLADGIRERGLGGLVLTSPENVFYTTGFTTLPSAGNPILYGLRNRLPFYCHVDPDGRRTLLCWGFAAEGIELGVDEVVGFGDRAGAFEALERVTAERSDLSKPIGVESSCSVEVAGAIARAVGAPPVVDGDELLGALRLIKSNAEVALLRRSLEIVEQVVGELVEVLDPKMTRVDLIQEAKSRAFRHGATGIGHATFWFAQANPELAIPEPLVPGSLVTLDLGLVYEGYSSDTRRYAYAGEPPASLLDRYRVMVEIVDEVGEALVPGRSYREVFDLAVRLYDDAGFPPLGRFNHTGHNIGIETEEEWLDDRDDRLIEPGMVINIELYSTAETGQQIGNEETYLITRAGPERISLLPRTIHAVDV